MKNNKIIKKLKIILNLLKILCLAPKCLILNKIIKKLYFLIQNICLISYLIYIIYGIKLYGGFKSPKLVLYIFQEILSVIYLNLQIQFVRNTEPDVLKILKLLNKQQKYFKVKNLLPKQIKNCLIILFIHIIYDMFFYIQFNFYRYFREIPIFIEHIYVCFICTLLHIIIEQLKIFNKNIFIKNYKIKKIIRIHKELLNILKLIQDTFSIILFYYFLWDTIIVANAIYFIIDYVIRAHITSIFNFVLANCLSYILIKLSIMFMFVHLCKEACITVIYVI